MKDKIDRIITEAKSIEIEPQLPRRRQIFVNRNLHMGHVDWIGFDLDYTLACYNKTAIEETAYEITQGKLVDELGYPAEVRDLEYDPEFMIRGLVIDTEGGNVLKLDRYAYVKLAFHGKKQLSRSERKRAYSTQKIDYASAHALDTLFSIPEACLFAQIVDLADSKPLNYPPAYHEIHLNIRAMIDKAHRDDTLKRRIRSDLKRFFDVDPDLAPMLERMRSQGKKLFLLTNSYWDYTDRVLSHLLDSRLSNHKRWLELFDCIVVGSRKPDFHTSNAPFLEVDTKTGMLRNTDRDELELGRVYQGGNAELLENVLGAAGERVVYFGDHIYGDILRSKKSLGWRTGLVIEELENEIEILEANKGRWVEMDAVDEARRRLETARDSMRETGDESGEIDKKIETLQRYAGRLFRVAQSAFNPYWGELFRAGKEVSLFGHQVEGYACLYTSRVSNFLYYPLDKYFRCLRGATPHDPIADDGSASSKT